MRRLVQGVLNRFGFRLVSASGLADLETGQDASHISQVRPFSMASRERLAAVADAVRYVEASHLAGAIVECGVWRGGSMMMAALTLRALGVANRELYLFDTFQGMTEPTAHDRRWSGEHASEKFVRTQRADGTGSDWCRASLDDVRRNMLSTGYPTERVYYCQGPVEQTLPGSAPEQVALLRLDTDWYESTRHELEHLYPRLVPGGILIIDDYGTWEGARRAVDEYFQRNAPAPFLSRIDHTCRLAVKPGR